MIIQTSCSELLVDTQIHNPEIAFKQITTLMKECSWESSPPLTVELLQRMKASKEYYGYAEEDSNIPEIVIYDKEGNRAWLEYGENGYLESLGFRFDSHCNHCDSRCFPIFDKAMERLNGQLISCDGGSRTDFYEWKGVRDPDESNND